MDSASPAESFGAARARRLAEIEAQAEPATARQMRFFFDLEEAAHAPALAASVDAVHGAGQARLLARLRGSAAGPDPDLAHVREVSLLVGELLARHFADGAGRARPEAAFTALARFGDAQLRSVAAPPGVAQHHNGEPNGPEFFLFGELALMAVRAGVEVERWRALAPALLGPQDVFCARYSNGPRRHVTGYRPVHATPAPPVDPATLADERLGLDFEAAIERSTRVGQAAFGLFP